MRTSWETEPMWKLLNPKPTSKNNPKQTLKKPEKKPETPNRKQDPSKL